jgi:hypothetical protein
MKIHDGWLIQGLRGASFYALLPPKKLMAYCKAARLVARRVGSHGETAFVFAGKT